MSHWQGFTLGVFFLFFGGLIPNRKVGRTRGQEADVARRCARLSLYELWRSPFCAKVRRCIKQLQLPIESRNVMRDREYTRQLVKEGGMFQIPCLRIEGADGKVTWMYESDDIIAYLRREFG